MMRLILTCILLLAIIAQLSAFSLVPGVPDAIAYQGRVVDDGTPYNGTGYFKFVITDSDGLPTWSNDSSLDGVYGEPSASVGLPVSEGLFQVILGSGGMTPVTSVDLPNTAYLRVWFSPDGTTFTDLTQSTPIQLASAPFALRSEEAAYAENAGSADSATTADAVVGSVDVSGAFAYTPEIVNVAANTTIDLSDTTYGDKTLFVLVPADGSGTLMLPTATDGRRIVIINSTGNGIDIQTVTGDMIDQGSIGAIGYMYGNNTAVFVAINGDWYLLSGGVSIGT